MSNSLNKKKKKSVFATEIESARKNQLDKSLTEDERKEKRYAKLDAIFENIANKKNRYLFYCPDIPFANSMVKIIYEYANHLQNSGYTVKILHEVKGFKADWLDYEWKKDLKIDFLQEKKNNRLTEPTFAFLPTDSIIVPDGFWTVMEQLSQMRPLHKIVLAFGYGGVITAQAGLNWSHLGFQDVLCVSENLVNDYKSLWPYLNYYVTGYEIESDKLVPLSHNEKRPVIGLMTRNREDASQLINTFYSKYPFLDIFEFKILKKLSTNTYYESLKNCSVLVFIDDNAGYPAPPVEAIALDVPVITVYGRGLNHLNSQEGILWVPQKDMFLITEKLAEFCYSWLISPTKEIKDKEIVKEFSSKKVLENLLNTFNILQEEKVRTFIAIKNAVDNGLLSDDQINANNE